MKIVQCVQGETDWLHARAGIVTASALGNLVTPTFAPREGKAVETYLYELLAERCMGAPIESGSGWAAEQGQITEREARSWVSFSQEVQIEKVGFVTTDDGMIGCSPDGLIGNDSGLELKCPQAPTHLKYLTEGRLPPEYAAQVHGSLYVTGRASWLFVSYNRFFPPLLVRVARDEKIMALIREAVEPFNARLAEAYAKMKSLAIGEDERPLPPGRQFRPLVFAA